MLKAFNLHKMTLEELSDVNPLREQVVVSFLTFDVRFLGQCVFWCGGDPQCCLLRLHRAV